jgi:hypothetical protein
MNPDNDLKSSVSGNNPVGLRSQVGGGLAVFIGLVLFAFYPNIPADAAVNLHQMAGLFIGVGLLALAAGTIARIFFAE